MERDLCAEDSYSEGLTLDMITERRSKVRYPLELRLRYQTVDCGLEVSGQGQTINVSSSGLLMVSESDITEGSRLKVTLEWPSLLNGTTPLQLVTVGTVVRRLKSNLLAVALEKYQFRTKKRTTPFELSAGRVNNQATPPGQPSSGPSTPSLPERSSVTAASARYRLQNAS